MRRAAMAISATRDDSEAGVAAIEFALVLPILMLILMGTIDYGYYFYLQSTVTNAAREGARSGVVEPSAGNVESVSEAAATAFLNNALLPPGSGAAAAAHVDANFVSPTVQVTVSMTFTPLTGFLPPALLPSSVQYQSSMRWESAP